MIARRKTFHARLERRSVVVFLLIGAYILMIVFVGVCHLLNDTPKETQAKRKHFHSGEPRFQTATVGEN